MVDWWLPDCKIIVTRLVLYFSRSAKNKYEWFDLYPFFGEKAMFAHNFVHPSIF